MVMLWRLASCLEFSTEHQRLPQMELFCPITLRQTKPDYLTVCYLNRTADHFTIIKAGGGEWYGSNGVIHLHYCAFCSYITDMVMIAGALMSNCNRHLCAEIEQSALMCQNSSIHLQSYSGHDGSAKSPCIV